MGIDRSCLRRCDAPHSLIALLRIAASRLLMSAADNWGRSILIVSLLSVPVNRNGGC
jgi:hypothetical protein